MKLYQAIAKRGKLKYYEEHISFPLDGTEAYNWRKIQKEKFECLELSLPEKLEFVTSKCKFKELDGYDWLKSDFKLPVFHNRLIEILNKLGDTNFKVYPVSIKDSKNELNINNNFSAVYINYYIDCIDRDNSLTMENQEMVMYNFKDTKFQKDFKYPVLFRIKDISTPYMHFTTEAGIKKLSEYDALGFDFEG